MNTAFQLVKHLSNNYEFELIGGLLKVSLYNVYFKYNIVNLVS